MLSYKMDFSSCAIMLGFGKSSHDVATSATYIIWQNIQGGKLLQLEYKMSIHRKTFVVAASFNIEYLWLVNYSLKVFLKCFAVYSIDSSAYTRMNYVFISNVQFNTYSLAQADSLLFKHYILV